MAFGLSKIHPPWGFPSSIADDRKHYYICTFKILEIILSEWTAGERYCDCVIRAP